MRFATKSGEEMMPANSDFDLLFTITGLSAFAAVFALAYRLLSQRQKDPDRSVVHFQRDTPSRYPYHGPNLPCDHHPHGGC
jgi:hypothetical protein